MKSQIGWKLGIGMLLMSTTFCFGQASVKKDAGVSKPAVRQSGLKVVQTDLQFRTNLDDLVLEQSEITRISHLSGSNLSIPVSIADLYQLVQTHNAFLQKWVTDHKVPKGWVYHAKDGTFVPSPIPLAKNKPGSKK